MDMARFPGRRIGALSVFTIASLLPVMAQPALGEIRIELKDPAGAAVDAAGLLQSLTSSYRHSFHTGESGSVTISGLPAGAYRLRIAKAGFVTHTALLEISPSTPVTHRVQLQIGAPAYAVSVVSTTPLAGLPNSVEEIPAPVRAATDSDFEASGALDLSSFLNRRFNNVFLNELQGNPLQPDLNFRGFTASPLLGTPQGLSLYFDGVRLNQPFGDVVSWDLIPRIAISEMALIPGSNPLFGLNTLGGAISLRPKDGLSHPGTSLQLQGGSFGRKMADFEHGGSAAAGGINWFLASTMLFENGWRESSPSNVRQFFGRLGSQKERTAINLTVAHANNALIGNGLQDHRLLERDFKSVYTKPDITANRAPFLNLTLTRRLANSLSFTGNAYFRSIDTRTLNGDINEESLDQSVYQPNAAERRALTAAGFTGFPTAGENAASTPFPKWRCIANALLRDEPSEKCNGLLNRSSSRQRNYGLSGQLTWFHVPGPLRNQFTAGTAYDGNNVAFEQSTELGYLNPDRSISGVGAFGDGVTGGEADGEPFDTRVDLSGRIHSGSFYVTDTLSNNGKFSLTLSGRFNRTTIDNRDRIRPLPGTGSLTGNHTYQRFNPAAGGTYKLNASLSAYAGYTEGNRAPTSIELGCADPNAPCRLPNSMAGDPPLKQVRATTLEAGVRGSGERSLRWSAGWFRSVNRDDILFVASEQTGYGYFKNFDRTRRQGLELDANFRFGRLLLGGGYTLLDATFQSEEEVNGAGNSTNEEARRGLPGVEGAIEIEPGNRIPLTPRHLLKAYADLQATRKLFLNFGLLGASSSFARGNENNSHQPDGRFYLGEGSSPGYAVANLGARFDPHPRLQFFLNVTNLFNRTYYTGAQLGATGFTAAGNFLARPFPAVNGEYPLQGVTFFAPGAPRGAWAGLRFRF
jgi:outer membrane receptor protein involved in Fe transport